ncbi:Thiamine transporter 2 [Folsomia candida]|uniref:Thiamine transporter 2 n=1 Tax=Folsomia candida TaxID=158441 RepID=A0A226D193_FOLCA|nr:Thiamine transporter 2 [Folsomia candida]
MSNQNFTMKRRRYQWKAAILLLIMVGVLKEFVLRPLSWSIMPSTIKTSRENSINQPATLGVVPVHLLDVPENNARMGNRWGNMRALDQGRHMTHEVFPATTGTSIISLIFLTMVTDAFSYKPIIVNAGVYNCITWVITIWGSITLIGHG